MMMGVYRRWRAAWAARRDVVLRGREGGRGLGPRPGTGEVEAAARAARAREALAAAGVPLTPESVEHAQAVLRAADEPFSAHSWPEVRRLLRGE